MGQGERRAGLEPNFSHFAEICFINCCSEQGASCLIMRIKAWRFCLDLPRLLRLCLMCLPREEPNLGPGLDHLSLCPPSPLLSLGLHQRGVRALYNTQLPSLQCILSFYLLKGYFFGLVAAFWCFVYTFYVKCCVFQSMLKNIRLYFCSHWLSHNDSTDVVKLILTVSKWG